MQILLVLTLSTLIIIILLQLIFGRKKLSLALERINQLTQEKQDYLIEKARTEEKMSLLQEHESKNKSLLDEISKLQIENSRLSLKLDREQQIVQEKIDLLNSAEQKFVETFKTLSSNALSESNRSFLQLAKTSLEGFYNGAKDDLSVKQKSISELVNPIKEALNQVGLSLNDIEKKRVGAYEAINQQVINFINIGNQLKDETSKLVAALKNPTTRGRWGEVQLRRVVEISGMVKHCDFEEQKQTTGNEQNIHRPDMIINMPSDRQVVVDAKTPLASYLQALEVSDFQERTALMREHSKHVRKHISLLSAKDYLASFTKSPDFIVMFIPGEAFLSMALEHDPMLMEYAMSKNVILTTPMTLLALLHSIERGWRQELVASNTKEVLNLSQEIYKRLTYMNEHFIKLGSSIKKTTDSYNNAISTLESRVMPSLRKIRQLSGKFEQETDHQELQEITVIPRSINYQEHEKD